MMRKLLVVQEGDTNLLPGRDVSIHEYNAAVKEVFVNGGKLPTAKPLLLGITKAALACQSFLSACSFQETTRILTSASIQSKTDNLVGLKENVIIGGLIPAGTGVLVEDEFECEHRPVDEEVIEEVLETYDEEENEDDFEDSFDSDDLEAYDDYDEELEDEE